MTWGSILVLAVIAVIVAAVIVKMIKDKKSGKSSCGGDCSSCRNIDQETKNAEKKR